MSKSYETIIQENEDKKLNKYLAELKEKCNKGEITCKNCQGCREYGDDEYDRDREDYEYERMMDRRTERLCDQ